MGMRGFELRGDLPGGRRELRLQIGTFEVAVTEIPAPSLTEPEWRDILLARRSFTAMWGGASGVGLLEDDPADGRISRLYHAWHYLAWVRNAGGPGKLVTMRKVRLDPQALTEEQRRNPGELLPVDIRFWRVADEPGCGGIPLWAALRERARRLAPRDRSPEFRISSVGRTGTFPFGERVTGRDRDRTAVAFAAMQVLAAHGDPSPFWVSMLCPEFRDRIMGIDVGGTYVAPAFAPTEEVLGLPVGSVRLDLSLPAVQRHRAAAPGYFVDPADAARVLTALLAEERVTIADLGEAIVRLIGEETARRHDRPHLDELVGLVVQRDYARLAEVLTRPTRIKHLAPLMVPGGPLTSLLEETGSRPFSSTVDPAAWAASARAVLAAAETKYGGPETATGDDWRSLAVAR
jgi:hypothetical protein